MSGWFIDRGKEKRSSPSKPPRVNMTYRADDGILEITAVTGSSSDDEIGKQIEALNLPGGDVIKLRLDEKARPTILYIIWLWKQYVAIAEYDEKKDHWIVGATRDTVRFPSGMELP